MKLRARRDYAAEIRSEHNADDKPTIRGTAAVFNALSHDLGGFRERIVPGAFSKTLNDDSTKKAYWNHNSDRVLGSTKSKTLRMRQTEHGLEFEIDPPEWANEHMESIERGDVDQMSFGFQTIKDRWFKDENDEVIRELVEVRLFEVSPVAMPAYPQTDAQVRSMDPYALQKLIVQAEHDLLDDEERAELQTALKELQSRTANDDTEPDSTRMDNHSDDEPISEGDEHYSDNWDSRVDAAIEKLRYSM